MAESKRASWPWHTTVAVGTAALAIHLWYWALVARHYVPTSDAFQYRELATNIAHGRGMATRFMYPALHPTAFRPPLWPWLLGAFWRLTGGSLGSGQLLNVMLGVASAVLAERYVRRIGGPVAGVTAGVLIAAYPPLLANDLTVLSDTLALTLLLALLIDVDSGRWIRAGIWSGLLVLTKPSAQAVVLVVALWLVFVAGWRSAVRLAASAVVVIMPWLARNWIELGSPVVVTSNGFNLVALYSPQASATGHFVDAVFDPRFAASQPLERHEVTWDRTLTRQAIEFVRNHPGQIAHVARTNFGALTEVQTKLARQSDLIDGRNPRLQQRIRPIFWLISAAGLIGLLWHRRDRRVQLTALVAGYFTLTMVVMVAPPRLRGPFDAMCCLGVGLLAGKVMPGVQRRPATEVQTVTSARQGLAA